MHQSTLTRRWGGGGRDPAEEEMLSALNELDTHDPEHPDCWLSHSTGWTISAFGSGLIVLENIESGDGPWHMKEKNKDQILALWKLLQSGDISAIRREPWLEGYGNS